MSSLVPPSAHPRGLGDGGPLFCPADRAGTGRYLTARALRYLVKRAADRAWIKGKGCSAHSLRHTYGVRALWGGANVVQVSKLLGRSSITTAQRYVDHLGLDDLRAALPALPESSVCGGSTLQDGAQRP